MKATDWVRIWNESHQRAFSVAAAMVEQARQQGRTLSDLLGVEAASFCEGKSASKLEVPPTPAFQGEGDTSLTLSELCQVACVLKRARLQVLPPKRVS